MRARIVLLILAALVHLPDAASALTQDRGPEADREAPLVEPLLRPAAVDSVATASPLEPLRREYRSAKLALAMTMVVPGWGQLYGDSPFWAVVAYSVQMFYIGNVVMEGRRAVRQEVLRDRAVDATEREVRDLLVTEHRERVRDFVWWGAAGYLVIGLDAFVTVQLYGFDAPYPPTPDLDRDWGGSESSGDGIGLGLTFDF